MRDSLAPPLSPLAPGALVTVIGGSGFLGRYIVQQLAEAYHEAIPRIMQRSASAQDVALASDAVV